MRTVSHVPFNCEVNVSPCISKYIFLIRVVQGVKLSLSLFFVDGVAVVLVVLHRPLFFGGSNGCHDIVRKCASL